MRDVVHVAGKEYNSQRYSFKNRQVLDLLTNRVILSNPYEEPDFKNGTKDYLAYMYASHLNDENIHYLFAVGIFLETSTGI